ncbi:MAG: NAD(P)-dependent oxidoreductase [Patescibacteria group bacterium]
MKIALFEVSEDKQEIFRQLFGGLEVSFFEEKLNEENVHLIKDAEIISVFINSELKKNVIDALPNLKLICTCSTGFDHIDISYCNSKGINVANVPAYGSYTVAEFTFALILNLSRKIFDASHQLKEGGDFSIFKLKGFDLREKTIGVVGTGKIGRNVIKIAQSFGMHVIACDLHPDLQFAQENNFEYKNLSELLSQSDILTLHAPYNKENHHLINKDNISLMKKGIYLINTARGELIDTDALISALKEGVIAGAGLDVLEGERELKEEIEILSSPSRSERIKDYKTLLEDRALIDMPNVIVTPHIAFYSKEAEKEIIKTTVANINGFLNNNLINIVK